MVVDTISDMLIQIKNAGSVKKAHVVIPYSAMKFEIGKELLKHGFIKSIDKKGKKVKRNLFVELSYDENEVPAIRHVLRISKPSRRVYKRAKELYALVKKRGSVFMSTPKGIATANDCLRTRIGGEVLFRIW